MSQHALIGLASLAIAAGLIFIGLPNKDGESPRFLRFHASIVVYPAMVLVFMAAGVAELMSALLTKTN